ncbi:MAG TPA: hypothetical protein PLG95_07710, partial [Methanoculleus sp.]|nr:hypothetical protein [Methanoculleus sp.]
PSGGHQSVPGLHTERPIDIFALANDDQIRDTAINILQFEKLGRPSVSVGIFEGQEGSSARSSRSSAISAISSSKTCRGTIGVRLRPVSLPFIFSS